jgi:hypothetical protein
MLKFENAKNGRFYYVQVQKDIFGQWIINCNRGGYNHSVQRILFSGDVREVREKLKDIIKRRTARGYTLIKG